MGKRTIYVHCGAHRPPTGANLSLRESCIACPRPCAQNDRFCKPRRVSVGTTEIKHKNVVPEGVYLGNDTLRVRSR